MFSFEGDFKGKRNINLGGRNVKVDKAELLRKAQLERQQRERERLKLQSAHKIQAFWRGRACVKKLRADARAEWDRQIEQCFGQLAAGTQHSIGKTTLSLVRQFWFFYSPLKDHQRLEVSLCRLLLCTSSLGVPILMSPYLEGLIPGWKLALAKILAICLESIAVNHGLSMANPEDVSNVIKVLRVALDPDTYTLLQCQSDAADWSGIYRGQTMSILSTLYESIRGFFLSHPLDHKRLPSITTLVHISTFPLQILQNNDPSMLRIFVSQLLTVPVLPNRIGIDALAHFSQRLPLKNIIAFMAEDADVYSLVEQQRIKQDTDPFAALLGNILAFAQPKLNKFEAELMGAYASVLQQLIQRLPAHYLNAITRDGDNRTASTAIASDDDEDDEMELNQTVPRIDPHLRKWLSSLLKPSHLEPIVRSLPAQNATLTPTASTQTQRVGSFLLALMTSWSHQKSDIGTILLFRIDTGLLQRLWTISRQSRLWETLATFRSLENAMTDPSFSGEWSMLVLFCELFVRLLTTLGDDELFGNKTPFPVQNLVELSEVMKNITFDLFWNERPESHGGIAGTMISLGHLTDVFTRLLQQIHARDSRRGFCPKDHWLMLNTPFDHSTFTDLVLQETSDSGSSISAKNSKARPCRAILGNIPFVIPFETRVSIFRAWVLLDREENGLDENWHAPVARVTIRRQYVFEDGFTHLNALGPSLKSRIAITFVSEQGLVEAGIDGGGVFKEFLTTLSRQAFDMNYGLFQATSEQLLYPSPHSYAAQDMQLHHLEFLGRIVGKALYEGVLVDVAFANFFLAKWLGQRSYLDDLPSLDPGLYQGLMFLKQYEGDVERDLGLTFSIDDAEFGEAKTINLIPNGANIPVTKENRIQYIYLMANYKLNTQIQRQCQAFFSGLIDLIDPQWLKMFNQQELQILLGGTSTPVNVADLKQNTTYAGGFAATHPTMVMLWDLLEHEFDNEQISELVKFVTSCKRPPLLGFKELRPGFCIRMAGEEVDRLPTASTCVNLLKMPAYTDKASMRSKLLYAISSGAGFELS